MPNLTDNRCLFALSWAIILIAVVLCLGIFRDKFKIDTDLLAILPEKTDTTLTPIVSQLNSNINQKIIVVADFAQQQDYNTIQPALSAVYTELKNSQLFELSGLVDRESQIADLHQYLLPYRQQLLLESDYQLLENKDYNQVVERALSELYGFGRVDENGLRQDPFQLFQRFFTALLQSNQNTEIELSDDWLKITADNRHYYYLFAELNQSPYNIDYQQKVKKSIMALKQQLESVGGVLQATGAILFAEKGFSQSKTEISTVGLGGLIGILLLFLYVFRSFYPLLWMLLLLMVSLLFSLAITLFIFTKIHIFALLMAAPLIGISIDYGFHFFTDFYFKSVNAKHTQKHIFKGLSLGLISSVLAYTTFFWGQVTVLQQVASMTIFGLLAMYLSILLLLPYLLKKPQKKQIPNLFHTLGQLVLYNKIIAFFRNQWAIAVTCLIALALLGLLVKANDDVRSYQSLPDELVQIENKINELTGAAQQFSYLIIVDKSIEKLLATEQQIYQQYAKYITVDNLYSLLPNRIKQQQNYQYYSEFYQSEQAKQLLDIVFANTAPSFPSLATPFKALDLSEVVLQEALQTQLSTRLINRGSEFALLIPTTELLQLDNKKHASAIYSYNQSTEISNRFADLRNKIIYLVVIVVMLLILLCLIRYQRLDGMNVALVPVLAGLISLLLTYFLVDNINIFNIMALLLLIGMGLDYVIFLRESQSPDIVIVSLILSCATTLLSFGLLALSQTVAVASFGLMITLGIILILLLSPIVIRSENVR